MLMNSQSEEKHTQTRYIDWLEVRLEKDGQQLQQRRAEVDRRANELGEREKETQQRYLEAEHFKTTALQYHKQAAEERRLAEQRKQEAEQLEKRQNELRQKLANDQKAVEEISAEARREKGEVQQARKALEQAQAVVEQDKVQCAEQHAQHEMLEKQLKDTRDLLQDATDWLWPEALRTSKEGFQLWRLGVTKKARSEPESARFLAAVFALTAWELRPKNDLHLLHDILKTIGEASIACNYAPTVLGELNPTLKSKYSIYLRLPQNGENTDNTWMRTSSAAVSVTKALGWALFNDQGTVILPAQVA